MTTIYYSYFMQRTYWSGASKNLLFFFNVVTFTYLIPASTKFSWKYWKTNNSILRNFFAYHKVQVCPIFIKLIHLALWFGNMTHVLNLLADKLSFFFLIFNKLFYTQYLLSSCLSWCCSYWPVLQNICFLELFLSNYKDISSQILNWL